MAQQPQTTGVKKALDAAQNFENEHYETGPDGSAKELQAGDFKAAMNAAGEYVSDAAQSAKEAVVGKPGGVSTKVADASDSAYHAQPAADGKTWTESMQDAGAAFANKLVPAAHAMQTSGPPSADPDGKSRGLLEDLGHKVEQSFEALADGRAAPQDAAPRAPGDKWGQAKADAKEGTQKLGDAASEAYEAATMKAQRAGDKAAGKADDLGTQAKGSYYEAKDVTLGAKDRVVDDTKEATGSAADSVNRTAEQAKQVDADASSGGENMFTNLVDSVKAVANRFTAPVTGDEDADKAAVNKVTGTADDTYGTARDKAEDAKGQVKSSWNQAKGQAQDAVDDAKDSFKSNFSEDTRAKAERSKNKAAQAADDASDSIRGAAADAKAGMESAAHDLRVSAEKKADEVENYLAADLTPHNATEAALQTGHIPSNTADVTSTLHGPGAGSDSVRDTEAAQGRNINADRLAMAADAGYGEENLGADDMADIREAADGAGLNAKYR